MIRYYDIEYARIKEDRYGIISESNLLLPMFEIIIQIFKTYKYRPLSWWLSMSALYLYAGIFLE